MWHLSHHPLSLNMPQSIQSPHTSVISTSTSVSLLSLHGYQSVQPPHDSTSICLSPLTLHVRHSIQAPRTSVCSASTHLSLFNLCTITPLNLHMPLSAQPPHVSLLYELRINTSICQTDHAPTHKSMSAQRNRLSTGVTRSWNTQISNGLVLFSHNVIPF